RCSAACSWVRSLVVQAPPRVAGTALAARHVVVEVSSVVPVAALVAASEVAEVSVVEAAEVTNTFRAHKIAEIATTRQQPGTHDRYRIWRNKPSWDASRKWRRPTFTQCWTPPKIHKRCWIR